MALYHAIARQAYFCEPSHLRIDYLLNCLLCDAESMRSAHTAAWHDRCTVPLSQLEAHWLRLPKAEV